MQDYLSPLADLIWPSKQIIEEQILISVFVLSRFDCRQMPHAWVFVVDGDNVSSLL